MFGFFNALFNSNLYCRYHLILLCLGITFTLLGYLCIYKSTDQEYRTWARGYNVLQFKIELLKKNSAHHTAEIAQCRQRLAKVSHPLTIQTNVLDTQLITLIEKTDLLLEHMQHIIDGEHSGWLLRLQGEYPQFLSLLDEVVHSFLPVRIAYVEAKIDQKRLGFILRIIQG